MVTLLTSSCSGHQRSTVHQSAGDTIRFEYAENISAIRYPDYTVVDIRNPWDTFKTLHTYILIGKDKPLPTHLPTGTVVRTPLQQSLVYSSVHCALFIDLNALGAIAGVCDSKYINLPAIRQGCTDGSIADCGSSMNPNIETIITTHPDAILLSPFENSGGYGKIEKLDIPIIECADYMESSPLGRAEWMKFYGMLLDKDTTATALFQTIANRYNGMSLKAKAQPLQPTVISELKSGAAWYVPTGRSTTGRLIADAGGQYIFGHLTDFGAIPLSVETVIDKGLDADIWLIKYGHIKARTLKDLTDDYAPYRRFKALQNAQVYGCNTFQRPFYEESPFHPDLLLADLIHIFHPRLFPDHQQRYFERLDRQ